MLHQSRPLETPLAVTAASSKAWPLLGELLGSTLGHFVAAWLSLSRGTGLRWLTSCPCQASCPARPPRSLSRLLGFLLRTWCSWARAGSERRGRVAETGRELLRGPAEAAVPCPPASPRLGWAPLVPRVPLRGCLRAAVPPPVQCNLRVRSH